jgi:two-component system CheB/CheR fusion protein
VVGIGASAGGLQSVKRFFEHMPADSGMAFVIIFHLSPDHPSIADKILREVTKMPVLQVNQRVAIAANHVYVISPAQQLLMDDGHLDVSPAPPRTGGRVTIDLFFRDLAEVHRERAFCVVLSGSGADGSVGLSRIKEQGGVTLVQSPEDAEFDQMPQSAIATGMVDLVLPVKDMPQKLLDLWHNVPKISLPPLDDSQRGRRDHDTPQAELALRDILVQLRTGTGHDFKHYKRATVLRRIERRMQVTAQADLSLYLTYLQDNPEETKALLDDMLIGVTNFFRDREAFAALERDVLPQLFDASGPGAQVEVRVWSAGCSTGEEAYSLAMLLSEQLASRPSAAKVQLFATDIDERAVAIGRAGAYPEAITIDVEPSRLRQNFIKEDGQYRIRKDIREKILFAKHSLLVDPPFSQISLISCRNLLIYLDREVQREILQMFHFALKPGGFLFLGSSESADMCQDLFLPVDKKNRIYRSKTEPLPARRMPTLPRGGYVASVAAAPAAPIALQRKVSFSDVHQRAISRFSPASMIVDPNADILHMTESAGRFLRHVGGELSRNLLVLVQPDLRLDVRTSLFQVQQSGEAVSSRPVDILTAQGDAARVSFTAHPYRDEDTAVECVLLTFEEVPSAATDAAPSPALQLENKVLANLETELQSTKLQLQTTIEQSEVSSEELKASNEEMQAINEELRSATEELETSKEELQSMNEELLTVNFELKTKVEETDKINDYLTNLIASTEIATVFVDRSLRIKWFTPRATDIFSMLPMDTGRPLMDITHRLDYPDMADDAANVFESLNVIEREVCSADGYRWYITRLLPYRSSEDMIDGIVLTFIDITRRHKAEDLQSRRLAETQTTSHLKDEFFAVMSHELKHPLNLIQLNSQVLQRLPALKSTAIGAKAVSAIGDAVNSQARIIDDLLDVARIRTGKLELRRMPLDLGAMLTDIHKVLQASHSDYRTVLKLPAELPLMIDADPTRVEQIIWNLLNNALKFTPAKGCIQLIASRGANLAQLDVTDSGQGLAQQSMGQIFDLFGQADRVGPGDHRDGLGIGLTLVRQLAEAHGGFVNVSSEGLGRGCTFTVGLPLLDAPPANAAPTPPQQQEGRLQGLHVLLVDDSAEVLETLKMLLEMEGAQVSAFEDPVQALKAGEHKGFDLIISDLGMPGMNGHELMQALRLLPASAKTPSIALTGYGASVDVQKSRDAGFDRHLGKPVAYDQMIETILQIIG